MMINLGMSILRLQLLLAAHALPAKRRDSRGAGAVEWLLLISAVIGIVAIANTGVRGYVTDLVGDLGQ